MDFRRVVTGLGLFILVGSTLSLALFHGHYFVLGLVALWGAGEAFLWMYAHSRYSFFRRTRLAPLSQLLDLYGNDVVSSQIIDREILPLKLVPSFSEAEQRWLDRLKDLMELKALVRGESTSGKKALQSLFMFSVPEGRNQSLTLSGQLSEADVLQAAHQVCELYWKLYDTASANHPELSRAAQKLYEQMLGKPFERQEAKKWLEQLTDLICREQGLPFVILNCLRHGRFEQAQQISQNLLMKSEEVTPELKAAVYWTSEILNFGHQDKRLKDYETTVRHLYHLCFTNPLRGGFLEIDSQFFSQFETVSELAQEAFFFKEELVHQLFEVWQTYEGHFEGLFNQVFEQIFQRKSKVYDNRSAWERVWRREEENFSKDYLLVIEGNLSFARGRYTDSLEAYRKAIALNPHLRPALANLLFVYAKVGDLDAIYEVGERVIRSREFGKSAFGMVGNAYLLAGDPKKADEHFQTLRHDTQWKTKVDYYVSTFCFEHGLLDLALEFGRKAYELLPQDTAVAYHLSLCLNAKGLKNEALDLVTNLNPESIDWLRYYRFTLERDVGKTQAAIETLKEIPSHYFQDADELEAALSFARSQQDLGLVRHLKRSSSLSNG